MPGDTAASPTLSVVTAPTGGDLDSEVAGGRRLQPTIFLDYRSTIDEPTTLPGGRRGWLSGGTYTLNGAAVRNIQLIVVERGFAYTLTGVSPVERFPEVEPAFRSSFTTFSVD